MAEAGGHGDFKLITEGLAGGWKGDNVTLPCHLSPETSASSMTIRWFKESECIYLYKNGQVIEGRGYEGRLTLNIQDLQKGNVSLTLRDYRDTDKGVYICQVKHGEQEEEIAVGLTDGGVKAEAKAYLSKETAEQKNRRLNSAHVFATQLEQQFLQKYQEQLKKGWELCKVIFPYEALHEDELSIKEGEIVAIVSKDCGETGWWMGEIGGRQGVFPDNFVKMLVPDVEKERPKKPPLPTAPSAKLTTEMATEQRKLTQEVEKLTAQLKQRDDQLKKKDEELRMMERDDVTTEENRLGVEQLQITLTTERELQNYTKEMAAEQRKLTQEVEKLTAQLRQRDDQLEKKDEDTSGVEQRKITEMKEDFMKKNWTELVKRVTEVQGVLDDLLREDFLSEETTSNIKAEGTSEAKVRMLHDIMKKKGKKAMSAFYDALQKHEKHLVKDLKEEGHH